MWDLLKNVAGVATDVADVCITEVGEVADVITSDISSAVDDIRSLLK